MQGITLNKGSGPNWIHGTENNPILDLAKETNTACFSPPIDIPTSVYSEDGYFVDRDTAATQTALVWETITEAYKESDDNSATIPPEMSLLDFFKRRVEEQNIGEAAAKQILQIARVWGDVVGEPIEMQSLKFFWLEECIEGGDLNSLAYSSPTPTMLSQSREPLPGRHLQSDPRPRRQTSPRQGRPPAQHKSNLDLRFH